MERTKSLNGELVEVDFAPFCEIAALLYNSAFVAERYAGIRAFVDANVSLALYKQTEQIGTKFARQQFSSAHPVD